jgi:phosphohistidine phosphatase
VKILYLARHAKSSWGDYSLKDFDRTLNDRGLRDAPAMGRVLRGMGQTPELIVTSPAIRALTTARLLAESMGLAEAAVVEVKKLYSAPAETILEVVNELGDEYARAMVVGHNPGMTMLAGELSRGGVGHMPTCSVASFEIPVSSWMEVRAGRGRLRFFETPKKHRS